MIVLVGLGNPGKEYAQHRHNVGYMVIDFLAQHFSISLWKKGFSAVFSEFNFLENRIILLKPETFMNSSGESLLKIMSFYKISPSQFFIFHDEIDVPFGTIRIKKGGGHAGHNGIRSISALCGVDTHRIRIGVGRPTSLTPVNHHVLGDFNSEEKNILKQLFPAISENLTLLLTSKFSEFQSLLMKSMNN